MSDDRIEAFCLKWGVTELCLFGSVLREDFEAGSDVDVMVSFLPEAKRGLFDLVRMQRELEKMFGRSVDLVSRRGIEASRNYIRRKAILDSVRVIYERTG